MSYLVMNLVNTIPGAMVLLLLGFFLLVKGADLFVEGSSGIAKKLHVPPIIIGLTIVAMGTSLPEMAVSVTASMEGNNALAVSNAVGSNIFNLMVVIGVCAVLQPVDVQRDTLKKDFPFSIMCAVMLLGLGYLGMTLGHFDGLILVVVFGVFILVMIQAAFKASHSGKAIDDENVEAVENIRNLSVLQCLGNILLGGVGIYIGGNWTVDAASSLALSFGISQTLVGLTIVSIGTSLPELVTSVVAARKNEVGMALGNAVGSNVFNILMVLGIASAISPIAFLRENIIDISILLLFSLIVWVMAWTRHQIKKLEGFIMLLLYAGYVLYIVLR